MARVVRFLIASAVLGALVWPASAAWSRPDAPQTLMVTAFVADQQCMGGDFVEVTLSATAQSTSQPVAYRWDFTNNGSFDTPASLDPTAQNLYPDEVNVTARVAAMNRGRDRDQDTVTFATLRCE